MGLVERVALAGRGGLHGHHCGLRSLVLYGAETAAAADFDGGFIAGAAIGCFRPDGPAQRGRVVSPWKAALATMVIFACGLLTGFFLERSESARQMAAFEAAGAAPPPNAVSNTGISPVTTVITRTNVVWAGPQAQRVAFLRHMVDRLHLRPEQHERIVEIIQESQDRSRTLWEQIAPQMRDELKLTTEEIRQELSPEQQRRFMELLRERRRENRARMLETNGPQLHALPRFHPGTNGTPAGPSDSQNRGI